MLESIRYSRGKMQLLDQTLLPTQFIYDDIKTSEDGWLAINKMKVRGAPAIAISAALSLAIEVENQRQELEQKTAIETANFISNKLDYLTTSRPTAVNLFEAANRLKNLTITIANEKDQISTIVIDKFIYEAEKMLEDDIAANKAIGSFGAQFILSLSNEPSVLTHCNTGSLATAGYGTALGVIRALNEQNKLKQAFCTETRPYNQGARLTALELVHEKINNATLITDSMVGALLQQGRVNAVVVGADRVTANGDTANKIGTYSIAILCKYHSVPFFVAAPTTTLDISLASGSQIVIEQRPANELTHINSIPIAAPGIGVWNPAFDVTPHNLITAIFTEIGVITKSSLESTFDIPSFLKQHLKK
eukprot:TRINITY_DN128_c1_g4_i1.p1 TRINITY_DN128_c1_g4~~TRINITY_DN128_c1_g4_i1.p1  ORF type:complete len:364 (-),score=220.87 TRINITY_DN128_c1_g4_i1:32-1123(-)